MNSWDKMRMAHEADRRDEQYGRRDEMDGYGERDGYRYGERSGSKRKLKELAEDFIDEVCEIMEDSYGERGDRGDGGYGVRSTYGERDGGYGERRGVPGTGRYGRVGRR